MKLHVLFRSTIRQPVRAVLLFFLVGAISFSFVSQVVQFLVVNREVDRISGYYRAIGTLNSPDNDDITNGISIIENSKYVAYDDNWRMSSGVLQGLHNPDIGGTSSDYPESPVSPVGLYVSDILIYGTINSKEILEISSGLRRGTESQLRVVFNVDYVEAGYPEYVQIGQHVTLSLGYENEAVVKSLYESLNKGERYFLRAYYNPETNDLRLKPISGELWSFPIQEGETIDFSSNEWAEFAKELEIMKENQSAMLVVGLKDMSAQPMVQTTYSKEGRYYLIDGRWLNIEDNINANRVCVVRQEFAELRGLSVGDEITLTMRELQTLYYGYIIFGEDYDNWKNYETHTVTFEIAGIYNVISTSITGLTSRNLNIFIPDSCMPAVFGMKGNSQSSYSFVLNSPRDIQSFMEETGTALSSIGMHAVFMDSGWETFSSSVEPILSSTSLNALVSGLALTLGLILAVFLYLRGRKHDFAILRALGVPNKAAVFHMLLPILVMGSSGTIVGGGVSWRYTYGKVFETLTSFEGSLEYAISVSLPLHWLVLLCTGIIFFLFVLTFGGVLLLSRQPVLKLLQDTGLHIKQNKKVSNNDNEQIEERTFPLERNTSSNIAYTANKMPEMRANLGVAQTTRYVFRHIVRTPLKACLAIVLPVCSIVAIGWIYQTIVFSNGEVERLYETTVVSGDVIKGNTTSYSGGEGGAFIRKQTIDDLVGTGFIKEMFVEAAAEAVVYPMINYTLQLNRAERGIILCGFDQPEHFFTGIGRNITIEYAGGLNEALFTKTFSSEDEMISTGEPSLAVLPIMLMERLSLQVGDMISIESNNKAYTFRVAGQYSGQITGELGSSVDTILMPLSVLTFLKEGEPLYISAEFVIDPAKNINLASFREEAESIVKQPDAGMGELALLLWDEELTKVVDPLKKNIELLTVLYPVVVIVSTLISIILSLLLITQRSKETAIMRILGATKLRVRIALILEQAALCLTGIIIGVVLVTFLSRGGISVPNSVVLCAFIYFVGTLFGAVVGAFVAAGHSPLELLQVKE